jgi:hypothetical protein
MLKAWQCRQFPRRDSRQTFRSPEDTSIGAVPLQAAKWSRPGKRDTSRTSPMTAAAMTGPDGWTSTTRAARMNGAVRTPIMHRVMAGVAPHRFVRV